MCIERLWLYRSPFLASLSTSSLFFFEYLRAHFQHENSTNVIEKISSFIDRSNKLVGFASIFGFVSESRNGTRDVCTLLVRERVVRFVYGGSDCCINNICEELEEVYFSKTTKLTLFVRVSIRHQHLLRRVFESVCKERYGMNPTSPLY